MISKWETEEEKLLRYMRIPAKKKLEWLHQMNEFIFMAFTKKERDIYQRLREESTGFNKLKSNVRA